MKNSKRLYLAALLPFALIVLLFVARAVYTCYIDSRPLEPGMEPKGFRRVFALHHHAPVVMDEGYVPPTREDEEDIVGSSSDEEKDKDKEDKEEEQQKETSAATAAVL